MVRYSSSNRGFTPGNPIANVLVVIAGVLLIAASVVLGFLAFVVLASVVLIMASIIGVRVWWFNRKLKKAHKSRPEARQTSGVIEGEYHEVIEDTDEPR